MTCDVTRPASCATSRPPSCLIGINDEIFSRESTSRYATLTAYVVSYRPLRNRQLKYHPSGFQRMQCLRWRSQSKIYWSSCYFGYELSRREAYVAMTVCSGKTFNGSDISMILSWRLSACYEQGHQLVALFSASVQGCCR